MGKLSFLLKKKTYTTILKAIGLYIILFFALIIVLRVYTHHGKSHPVPDFKGLDKERVAQLAKYNKLRVQIIDSTFIGYLPKGCVIEQNPEPGIRVKKNRTIFLTINAFNQSIVEVPNLIGLSYRQGKSTLESRGLKVGKIVYVPDYAENNILKQKFKGRDIEHGTQIEKGEAIDLVLGNGYKNNTYQIPDLFNCTLNKAISEIKSSYFNVGDIIFDESVKTYNDSVNARVYKQNPKYYDEKKAYAGSQVNIWLSLNEEYFINDTTQTE